MRLSAVAAEAPETQGQAQLHGARLKTERLLVALRLAWGLLFASLLVAVDSFPREWLVGVLNTIFANPEAAAWAARAVFTLSVVLAVILLGDILPGAYGARYPGLIARWLMRPISFGLKVLGPLPGLIQRVARALTHQDEAAHRYPAASEEDIRHLAQEVHNAGVIEEGERKIIERVFKLGDRPVVSVMTPRADVIALPLGVEPGFLLERALASGFSRFPVIGQGEEEVIGVVTLQSLTALVLRQRGSGCGGIESVLNLPLQVPESVTALQLLDAFREKGQRFAIIVDEYGGFAGVATLTDVLELLVGEIGSGQDNSRRVVARADGSFLVDSGIDIEDLFELLGLRSARDTSSGEFRSLGGFLMTSLGHVPAEGQSMEAFGHIFQVLEMDGNRIDKVLVSVVLPKKAVA